MQHMEIQRLKPNLLLFIHWLKFCGAGEVPQELTREWVWDEVSKMIVTAYFFFQFVVELFYLYYVLYLYL